MKYLVLYQRTNGEMLYRFRKSLPEYEVGSYTSMGWKLLDIKQLDNGKCLSMYDYSIVSKNRVVEFTRAINYKKIIEYIAILLLLKNIL